MSQHRFNATRSIWSQTILRGARANDLAGKAGDIGAELEERLVSGHYSFGEKLSIYALAEEFGSSRQPVSAAVQYLATVGYLEVIPQVGCRVVSPSAQDVQDFYRLFARTEALVASFAAERQQAGEADLLVEIADSLAANAFQSSQDRRDMADAIALFHDHMSQMARSAILVDRISNFRRIFRFYLSQNREEARKIPGLPQRMNDLRKKLSAAIRAGDGKQSERIMEEYILDDLLDWARVV